MLRVHGTILEWFKQKQEICESGRVLPYGNCQDQTTQLLGTERVLERYEKDPDTILLMSDTQLLFRVLSMLKVDLWYSASIKCCYYESPNYAST